MDKNEEEAFQLLEDVVVNNYQWSIERLPNKKAESELSWFSFCLGNTDVNLDV